MSELLRDNKYLFLFAISFSMFSVVIFIYNRTDVFPWIGKCNWRGYDADHYMAYCHSHRFGDYEHLAFWNNSEPEVLDNLKKASVLFLGNSRTQYAFSTSSVDSFFAEKDISYYVFGFGMNSQKIVPERMIRRYNLRPKLLVINADPFFTEKINDTNKKILSTTWVVKWEYSIKKWQQEMQRKVCNSDEPEFIKWLLSGSGRVVYRSRKNGHWSTKYFRKNQRIPVGQSDRYMGILDQAVGIGEQFINELNFDKSCLVITATPQARTPSKYAKALSQRLGITAIFPKLEGLLTIDRSHLDPQSAERWSNRFLNQLEPLLERCLSRNVSQS